MRIKTRPIIFYLLISISAITFGWYLYIATNKTRIFVTHHLPLPAAGPSEAWQADGRIQISAPPLLTNQSINITTRSFWVEPIECSINQQYVIDCLLDKNSKKAYLPFDFVRSYFDVYGQVRARFDGRPFVQFEHSYSKVHYPSERYDSKSAYLWFDTYNVEERDRVLRMSGRLGVPVSSQWSSAGHLYPVQICQFGLSHYNKYLQNSQVFRVRLEDGTLKQRHWIAMIVPRNRTIGRQSSSQIEMLTQLNGNRSDHVLSIRTDRIQDEVGFQLRLRKKSPFYRNSLLSMQLRSTEPFRIRVVLTFDASNQPFNVIYTNRASNESNDGISDDHKSFAVYYIGDCSKWTLFARNVALDLFKRVPSLQANKRRNASSWAKNKLWRISQVYFSGQVQIDNVTLNSNLHLIHFDRTVEWLLRAQDTNGGWPVQVQRTLLKNRIKLSAGWYSAMAQGQAMSLLVRKHFLTGAHNTTYLSAAIAATQLFDKDHTNGGVRTRFLDRHVWYEEYPTEPSLFVLNGFVYSLFGLYDLKSALQQTMSGSHIATNRTDESVFRLEVEKALNRTSRLFADGFASLTQLLPLFDTGSGSLYDLRHYSLQSAPNLARWDYHSTHINQLLYLNSIMNVESLRRTADRWIGYMQGQRAAHN